MTRRAEPELEWAAHHHEFPTAADLTPQALVQLVQRYGIDRATAVLFHRLRYTSRHTPFIEAIDAGQPSTDQRGFSVDAAHGTGNAPTIVVVPGAFYREFPSSGANGEMILAEARKLGLATDRIPLSGFGSLRENGQAIREWLACRRDRHPAESLILVSLSKGAADLKAAWSECHTDVRTEFSNVRAWISLSGILNGTPLSNWLMGQPLRSRLVACRLWWWRYSLAVVRELTHGGEWASAPLQVPPSLRLVHVVGFPLRRHLSTWLARRGHRRLAKYGPNDSTLLLADALQWPGDVYPLWGRDHYLRAAEDDIPQLVARVLRIVR